MNGEAFQSSSERMWESSAGGSSSSLWSFNNCLSKTHPPQTSLYSLLPSSSSSSSSSCSVLPQQFSMAPWHDNIQELPHSWSQLLMEDLVEEKDRYSFTPFQSKNTENWQNQVICPTRSKSSVDLKQELFDESYNFGAQASEEIQKSRSTSWTQILSSSSPTSCVTTNFNSSMLDFSNSIADTRRHQLDYSFQECNSTSTGSPPYKKPKVQASSTQSTLKVRKEKLGERISALHQIVSPFGKTNTASVLLEAIGYIKFLHSQIEALSSPYLSANINQLPSAGDGSSWPFHGQGERNCLFPEDPGQLLNDLISKRKGQANQDDIDHEPKNDLRSRGLCLVPISFTTMQDASNDIGADYWPTTFGGNSCT